MEIPLRNQSLQELQGFSAREKYGLLALWVLITLISVLGNSVILVGSIKFNAIKLGNVTRVLIHHLACADLGMTLFAQLPKIVSIIADRWYFGETFCSVRHYIMFLLHNVSMLLICSLSVTKLAYMSQPLRSILWNKSRGSGIAGLIWVMSVVMIVTFAILTKGNTVFYPILSMCCTALSKVKVVLGSSYTIVAMIILVASTLRLLFLLYRMSQRKANRVHLKLQGVVTVILIGVIFCIAYTPLIIFYLIKYILMAEQVENEDRIPHVVVNVLTQLNNISNFFIYTISFKSFRNFILKSYFLSFFRPKTKNTIEYKIRYKKRIPIGNNINKKREPFSNKVE